MNEENHSSGGNIGFIKGMIVYFLVFTGLLLIGAGIFCLWLNSYEQSRPDRAIKNYIAELTPEHVLELTGTYLSDIDTSHQSLSDCSEEIYNELKSSSYAKNLTVTGEDTVGYYLRYNGEYIADITFAAAKHDLFGHNVWSVLGESLMAENITGEQTLTVPSDYVVTVNGVPLTEDYIADGHINYSILSGFSDTGYPLPYLVSYTTGKYFGEPEIDVYDASGVLVSEENRNETYYFNNCSADELSALQDFANDFITRYVDYTSAGQAYYYYLLDIVGSDCILRNQIISSLQGFGFASSGGDSIQYITVNSAMKLSPTMYALDITYDVVTYGRHSMITESQYNMALLASNETGRMLAYAMNMNIE